MPCAIPATIMSGDRMRFFTPWPNVSAATRPSGDPPVAHPPRNMLRGLSLALVTTMFLGGCATGGAPDGRVAADTFGQGVKNLILSAQELKSLATRLKQACGTGGTVKDGQIEIQGEQREQIAEILRKLGYKVKVAGG